MKLQSYDPQVRPSQPGTQQVVVSNDINAYGNSGAGLRDLASAVNQWTVQLDKQIENEDRTAILQAMDAYSKGRYDIMYNEKDGLMNTKGEGASGISQIYTEKMKALRAQVLDTFKVQKKDNLAGLINRMDSTNQQGFAMVDRWQYQQGEVVKDSALNNNLTDISTMLQKNYRTPGAIDEAMANAHLMISVRYGDAGKEVLETANKKADAQILGATISGAIAQNDFNNATAMLKVYGDMLTPQQKVQFTNTLQAKGSQEHLYSVGRTAYSMFGDNEADALEWMSKQPGYSVGEDSNNRPMDEMEVRQAQNNYFNEVNTAKRIEQNFVDNSIIKFGEEVYKMLQDGKGYDDAIAFANEKAGNNIKLIKAYNSVVKSYYGKNTNSGARRITADDKRLCYQWLSEGLFKKPEDYKTQIASMGGDATDQLLAMKEWKDWRYGKGKFKYSGSDLLKMAAGDNLNKIKQDSKAAMERAIQYTVGTMIADYQLANHKEPTEFEVVKMAKEAVKMAPVPGLNDSYFIFDWNTKSSPAALRMAGIVDVIEKSDNTNEITLDDGTKRIVTDAELRTMIRDSTNLFERIK